MVLQKVFYFSAQPIVSNREKKQMGLSSSQARLLHLTGRMHQIEYKAQKLEAQKLQLANESSRVYEEYENALDATKIQYKSLNADGSTTFLDATLASLENGSVAGYDGITSGEQYFLQNTQTGAIYLSKDYANSIGITSDSVIETRTLEQYLIDNNAPKKPVQVQTGTETDTDNVIGVDFVKTPTATQPAAKLYTVSNPVANSTTHISDAELLQSGKTYSVSSAEELKRLSEITNNGGNTTGVKVILTNYIDMSSVSDYKAIKDFRGTFDGNGHTITGLKDALFGITNNATISNVKLNRSNVSSVDQLGTGILANRVYGTTISNVEVSNSTVSATSTVVSASNGQRVGGLVGISDGKISNCSVKNSTVNGLSKVGGLVGQIGTCDVDNCSVSGTTVSGKTRVGGFAGCISTNTGATVKNCSSDCTVESNATDYSTLNNDGSVSFPNPDSAGFIAAIDRSSDSTSVTISYCKASGTMTDSTSGYNKSLGQDYASVIAGFVALGQGTMENCDCDVDVKTKQTIACGYSCNWSSTGRTLTLKNCNFNGTVDCANKPEYEYLFDFAAAGTINATNCYANTTGNGSVANVTGSNSGASANGSIATGTTNRTNSITVNPPSFSDHGNDKDFAISDLKNDTYAVPTTDSLVSNIEGALVAANLYDPQNTSSADKTQLENKIKAYLNSFGTDDAGLSKLYHLNESICIGINNNACNAIARALMTDINAGTNNNTASYYAGKVLPNVKQTVNGSCNITYNPNSEGQLQVPNKATIKANIMAAQKLLKNEAVSESQIDTFLNNYSTGNETDLAYLAHINDLATSKSSSDLTTIINAVQSNNKISELPDYITDITKYNITYNSNAETPNQQYGTKPTYRTDYVIDYDAQRTKELINEYNIKKQGYIIVGDENDEGMDKSTDWLTNIINSGMAILVQPNKDKSENAPKYIETSVATNTYFREADNEKNLKKAEAKYEADMKRIDLKDRKYDTDLAAMETERNAIKEEMETLKTVAKDNVERTFKLFS